MSGFSFDPARPSLTIQEPRLHFLFTLEPLKFASLGEYAGASGLDIMEVLEALDEALDLGVLALEAVGDEMFVHTHPGGVERVLQVQPNLWEVLRLAGEPEYAYSLWRLVRGLEWAGWRVLVRPERARGAAAGFLSLEINGIAAPVIAFPSPAQLASGGAFVAAAGESCAAVAISAGSLEESTTAVRKYLLSSGSGLRVVLLEAPRYQPVLLETGDTAVRARNVSVESLQNQ